MHSESDDEESDASTFLWDDDESDSESEDDADTIEEPEPTPVASKPEPVTASPATPPHSRKSSTEHPSNRNCTARPLDFHRPWYMQVDPACLSSLDDQLLQSPLDAFADLCYAQAVRPSDLSAAETQVGHSYGYSWRRLSRLLSACPEISPAALGLAEQGRESESESDTDSEQLASPEQAVPAPVPGWGLRVYEPKSEREQAESPYRCECFSLCAFRLASSRLVAFPTADHVVSDVCANTCRARRLYPGHSSEALLGRRAWRQVPDLCAGSARGWRNKTNLCAYRML